MLEAGADPSLQCCPYDDYYENAQEAAENNRKSGKTSDKLVQYDRIQEMLKAAGPFWKSASYSSASAGGGQRNGNVMNNQPTNLQELAKAVNTAFAAKKK